MPHFLESIFKPDHFTPEQLAQVIASYQRTTAEKHTYLMREGSAAPYYFFLESGFARSYAVDPDGNDITTQFFGPADIVIDWQSFFQKTPCREAIQAITPVVGWRIAHADFMKLFSIEAFREVGRTRLINSFFDLKSHTVSVIADPAKERYLHLLRQKSGIVQNVPLKQIATYLGITDTSLSRIRNEIAREK
jgi:CRP-like cAMP-binding protein